MRMPKHEKVEADISNAKAKISEWQDKLRALEKLKTDIENDKMLKVLRDERISDAELSALLEAYKKSKANIETASAAPAAAVKQTVMEDMNDADDNE